MEKTSSKKFVELSEYSDYSISKWRPVQKNDNGFVTVFPHYSCHPERDPATPAGVAWQKGAREGVASDNDWRREQEIDFMAHVGKPIFPDFNDKNHVRAMEPDPDLPIIRGWDPAWRHAVCVWMQVRVDEDTRKTQLRWLREQTCLEADMGVLADMVLETEEKHYKAWKGQIWDHIDVAAKQHSQTSQTTAIEILGNKGITARYKKIGPEERILMFNYLMGNRMPDGEFCLQIDQRHCPRSYTAFRGLYRRKQGSNRIDENEACHYIDAGGYGAHPNVYFPRKRKKEKAPQIDTGWLKEVIGVGRVDVPTWKAA